MGEDDGLAAVGANAEAAADDAMEVDSLVMKKARPGEDGARVCGECQIISDANDGSSTTSAGADAAFTRVDAHGSCLLKV